MKKTLTLFILYRDNLTKAVTMYSLFTYTPQGPTTSQGPFTHKEGIRITQISEQNFELMEQIQPECINNQTIKRHFFLP